MSIIFHSVLPSPLCFLPHFSPPVFSQLHPHPLCVLQAVHFQRHLFPQAFQEIVQLLSFSSSKIVIALAEPEVNLQDVRVNPIPS